MCSFFSSLSWKWLNIFKSISRNLSSNLRIIAIKRLYKYTHTYTHLFVFIRLYVRSRISTNLVVIHIYRRWKHSIRCAFKLPTQNLVCIYLNAVHQNACLSFSKFCCFCFLTRARLRYAHESKLSHKYFNKVQTFLEEKIGKFVYCMCTGVVWSQ